MTLLRKLDPVLDDSVDLTPHDDYWGDEEWKKALGTTQGHPGMPPEGATVSLEDLAMTLRRMADTLLQKFILQHADEVQVPAGTA